MMMIITVISQSNGCLFSTGKTASWSSTRMEWSSIKDLPFASDALRSCTTALCIRNRFIDVKKKKNREIVSKEGTHNAYIIIVNKD